ncbi:MAG: RNA polymerase sigma factor [Planctomycetia bacterium]
MDSDDMLAPALAACLERLAAGDASARDRIIEICSERLRGLAHRMLARFPNVRRWDDTDDVFQNAALRLHRSLGQLTLSDPRSVMALAATHVRRELLDLARRHAGPLSYAANHGTNAGPGAPDEPGRHHVDGLADDRDRALDRWTELHAAIDRLPAPDREVFHLVWYMGCDQHTIARLLDCSPRTVKSRWRAGREAVKAALGGQVPE